MTPASDIFAVAANSVHVWHLDLSSPEIAAREWEHLLSADEQARARRYRVEGPRRQFVATRGFLRVLLGCYLGTDPKSLNLRNSTNQKPALGPPYEHSRLQFNVSHSGEVSLLAFSHGRQVGIDVERLRRDFDVLSIARRCFSAYEQKQLEGIADIAERFEAYFRCWTRKEAFIKANGAGLSLPLGQFDVSIVPADRDALVATRPDSSEVANWLVRDIPIRSGYVGALCASGKDWQLESRTPAEVVSICEAISVENS